MPFRLLRRSPDPTPQVCECGEPLYERFVGAAQRWGGEPVVQVHCLHCDRCGDIERR